MAVKSSGPLSLTDIKLEFLNLTDSVSFTDLLGIADGVPEVGPISLSIMYGKTYVYLKVITNTITNLNVESLFTPEEWNSATPKEVLIAPGATVGSSLTDTPALIIPNTGVGKIKINNEGSILGAGGVTPGQAGGHAIQINRDLVTIENKGLIGGGGGAGGNGGRGGQGGLGSRVETIREPTTGEYFSSSYRFEPFLVSGWVRYTLYWAGATIASGITSDNPGDAVGGPRPALASYTYNGITYFRGSRLATKNIGTKDPIGMYGVWRSYSATVNYQGGLGGLGSNGGRGAGFNQTAITPGAGALGAVGGINAGTGGQGGAGGKGGELGQAGATGNTGGVGTAGNAGAALTPAVGSAGGAAGRAITGNARTLINTGTILGSVNV